MTTPDPRNRTGTLVATWLSNAGTVPVTVPPGGFVLVRR